MVLNRWQNPGDVTDIQMASQAFGPAVLAYFNNMSDGSISIVDASFIRLKNISLSWNLPRKLKEKLRVGNTRLYIQGQNILTITDYIGLDPESRVTSLPPLRMWTAGIQFSF